MTDPTPSRRSDSAPSLCGWDCLGCESCGKVTEVAPPLATGAATPCRFCEQPIVQIGLVMACGNAGCTDYANPVHHFPPPVAAPVVPIPRCDCWKHEKQVCDVCQNVGATPALDTYRPAPASPPSAPPRSEIRNATDAQLSATLGNCLADLSLAEKYPHNAHLVPKIHAAIDEIGAEQKARMLAPPAATPPAPDTKIAAHGSTCPCVIVTPCQSACSCADKYMSGGCMRCATFGSAKQRREAAAAIAHRLDTFDAITQQLADATLTATHQSDLARQALAAKDATAEDCARLEKDRARLRQALEQIAALGVRRMGERIDELAAPTPDAPPAPTAAERERDTWRWLHWGKLDASWACPCGSAHSRAVHCEECDTWRPMKPSILAEVQAGAAYDAALVARYRPSGLAAAANYVRVVGQEWPPATLTVYNPDAAALSLLRETVRNYLKSLTLMGPDITAPPQFWEMATALKDAVRSE